MLEVVDRKDGAGILVHAMRAVLGCEVDRHQCCVPARVRLLMVVSSKDGAGVLVHAMRAVLGGEVDRQQCCVPARVLKIDELITFAIQSKCCAA